MSQLILRYQLASDGTLAKVWLGTPDGELDISGEVLKLVRHAQLGPADMVQTPEGLVPRYNPRGNELVALVLRDVDVIGTDSLGLSVVEGVTVHVP